MMIEFYTQRNKQFIVTENRIYQNGEVIAEGRMDVYHLMLHEPAYITFEQGEDKLPVLLKFDKVTAVFPIQEIYRGTKRNRTAFKMSYLVYKKEEWIRKEEVISAVDDIHARQLLRAQYGKGLRGIQTDHIASLIDSLTPVQNQM